jgi:UDP-N-acetylglucosamine--N-acetylmuramyl-(pentapeptide) pyrophosphoryl-undecaprenol N-acetylglucosamine transferase
MSPYERRVLPGDLHDAVRPDRRRRLAIAAGGTAGHVYPALVIADTYERAVADVEVDFIGTPEGCESRLVPAHGHRLALIQGSPWSGAGVGRRLRAARTLAIGFVQARRLLRRQATQLAIGFGGYASVGALLAARSLGVRTVIHEANVMPGLANRRLGRFADRVYLGYAAAAWAFPDDRTRVTGNPVRPEISRLGDERCYTARTPVRILVLGGSRGASFVGGNVPEALGMIHRLGLALEVRHQAGDDSPERVRAAYAGAGVSAVVTPYIEDMAAAYRWADFAITRSGASTVAELAACALPALLVPLSTATDDHQTLNARTFEDAGGGWVVSEADWRTREQVERLYAVLRAPRELAARAAGARRLATPAAASAVVADCEALLAVSR